MFYILFVHILGISSEVTTRQDDWDKDDKEEEELEEEARRRMRRFMKMRGTDASNTVELQYPEHLYFQ